ncbi:hypothetical protein B0H16DRAFT_1886800 [Mycena metata]|uniref:Uncharacterized protein n=1 Tax=Mycena metata TaxID=1033252 RepID=A0AAD7IZR8_9AGAR|nr:hypothetical protein B0H16DRAFT_1886800 [Mycena metata]
MATPPVKWGKCSTLAKETIEKHVAAHKQYVSAPSMVDHVPSLVDLAAQRLAHFSESKEESDSFEDIPLVVLEFHIWKWDQISFIAFRRALLRLTSDPDIESPGKSVDEWILLNEQWLRDGRQVQWQEGLVTLDDVDAIFPNSILTDSSRTIKRPVSLPGFEILCTAREPHIIIQPSNVAFKRGFEYMSDGLLKNLDWNNILVAGGIVLGTLLSVDSPEGQPCPDPRWRSSDIDIYIYGLSPAQANEKVKHLFETFCANLPPGSERLAVKNSTTITFYARYPLRRIQIVLKLVKSPKTVLLNFDLDICAMGWDGTTVWMLPRAARALETGYNVFSMSLIHGHYLSDRRASSQERIFKYADKGYGIRILPSYISSLKTWKPKKAQRQQFKGPLEREIIAIAEEEKEWTTKEVLRMVKRRAHVFFQALMPRHAGYRASRCLKGFRIFMRCAALWEMGHRGVVKLDANVWASTEYQDAMTTYDDAQPSKYKWDENFKIEAFKKRLERSNFDEIYTWVETDYNYRLAQHGITSGEYTGLELKAFQRIVCTPTVDELFSKEKDILLQVLLPCSFAVYANDLVSRAQADAGIPETKLLESAVPDFNFLGNSKPEADGLFFWRISKDMMWQQFDRRVDEVFEMLHAFRRINEHLRDGDYLQADRFRREMARREVYDELDAFARWVQEASGLRQGGPSWDSDDEGWDPSDEEGWDHSDDEGWDHSDDE